MNRIKTHVRKGDLVQVISGRKDGENAIKGKQGRILEINAKSGYAVVEGLNFITRHVKKTEANEGGRVQSEGKLHISKLKLVEAAKPVAKK
jgi:large subunit ribosomal protein L24